MDEHMFLEHSASCTCGDNFLLYPNMRKPGYEKRVVFNIRQAKAWYAANI